MNPKIEAHASKMRQANIRIALLESPSTTGELAAILGVPPRAVRVGMWLLCRQGFARKTGAIVRTEKNYPAKLYELTPAGKGRAWADQNARRRIVYLKETGRL